VLGVFHDNNCLAIGSRDGAAIEWNILDRKAILFSLGWDLVNDRKVCFNKRTAAVLMVIALLLMVVVWVQQNERREVVSVMGHYRVHAR